jgi:hypothetical protein
MLPILIKFAIVVGHFIFFLLTMVFWCWLADLFVLWVRKKMGPQPNDTIFILKDQCQSSHGPAIILEALPSLDPFLDDVVYKCYNLADQRIGFYYKFEFNIKKKKYGTDNSPINIGFSDCCSGYLLFGL